jgi:hypothetical protein
VRAFTLTPGEWRGAGNRTPSELPEKTARFGQGGAESGAHAIPPQLTDPGLASLIDAWPKLPDPIKAGILTMVRAAGE